jgi:hypothetical protein
LRSVGGNGCDFQRHPNGLCRCLGWSESLGACLTGTSARRGSGLGFRISHRSGQLWRANLWHWRLLERDPTAH